MRINLDTEIWITPTEYARRNQITTATLNHWIVRGQIENKYIEDWELRLIKASAISTAKKIKPRKSLNSVVV